MEVSDARKLKSLEEENARLKKRIHPARAAFRCWG
jgi:hypothetical protein